MPIIKIETEQEYGQSLNPLQRETFQFTFDISQDDEQLIPLGIAGYLSTISLIATVANTGASGNSINFRDGTTSDTQIWDGLYFDGGLVYHANFNPPLYFENGLSYVINKAGVTGEISMTITGIRNVE